MGQSSALTGVVSDGRYLAPFRNSGGSEASRVKNKASFLTYCFCKIVKFMVRMVEMSERKAKQYAEPLGSCGGAAENQGTVIQNKKLIRR